MTEPEVSLYIALYFIKNELTDKNVHVSIDGAYVKTKNTIHFEIEDFYLKNGFKKLDTECDKWQGEFAIEGYDAHIIVSSKSGIGDVVIETKDDSTIIVESKKFSKEKGYSLMREAIGQLMTGSAFGERIKPVVAISYTEKSNELAKKMGITSTNKKCRHYFLFSERRWHSLYCGLTYSNFTVRQSIVKLNKRDILFSTSDSS